MNADLYRQVIEALRPFAKLADSWTGKTPAILDDMPVLSGIQVADFRRAQSVLTKLEHAK